MPEYTPSIDYTSRDFLTIRDALRNHLMAKFPTTWRDFYECLTGDTKVPLLDGTEHTIESLVGKPEFWVYSYDQATGRIVPGKAIAKKTRENAELVEVELDNSEKVRCTPDHEWMLRDGTYKEAQYLLPGDSLMPLYRRLNGYGYEELKQPDTKSRQLAATNHKVVMVRRLLYRQDCYCLAVSEFHNFALSAGVFVHNSGMGQALMDLVCYCVSGDTKISLVNGTEVEISSLVGKGEVQVYAYDHEKGKIVSGKGVARKTQDLAPLVEVVLDNDQKIKCTANHPFILRSGGYKLAADLLPGDSLMPLYRKESTELPGYEMLLQPDENKWHFTHRQFVSRPVPEGCRIVHHKDFNKRNNCPDNLQWMSKSAHSQFHTSIEARTEEGRRRRSEIMRRLAALRSIEGTEVRRKFLALVSSPEWRSKVSERQKGEKNSNYGRVWSEVRRIQASQAKRDFWASAEGKVAKEVLSAKRLGSHISDEHRERISLANKGVKKSVETRLRMSEARKGKPLSQKECDARSQTMKRRRAEGFMSTVSSEIRMKMAEARRLWWASRKAEVQLTKVANHKVVSVRLLDQSEPVYCLEIPLYHNFALSAGVFTGNSHDVLSFFVDYTANELFLPTARDRISILLLGRLLGYQLRTATSASVVAKATIDSVYGEAVIIPAGTALTTLGGVSFVTAEAFRIEAGETTISITFVSGVNRAETFNSDGSIWQKFVLSQSSVIEDTVEVLVDGDVWSEVSSLVLADGDAQAFSVEYNENGVATITFGDGTNGRVPPAASVISAMYRTGGGIEGNIALNQLTGTVQGQRESIIPAAYVTVTILNDANRGAGGEDAETVTHAKLWIPYWVRANGRAVTETDYDVLANAFSDPTYGSPAFVKAKLKQEIPELNTVELYCLTGDTKIKLLDGTDRPIKDLADSETKEFYVYSFDPLRGRITVAKAFNPRLTKNVNELVEVVFDNGEILRCTVDHKILLRDGSFKEAGALVSGESLMPIKLNHKVASVRRVILSEPVPVYDLSVEKHHNFALSSGVFVHNCWARDYVGTITTPSIGLKNALSTYFNDNGPNGVKCICTHTEVLDGKIVYIDITMSIRVASNYVEADVLSAVQTAIDNLFASADVQPGTDFRISALYSAVKNVAGLDYCLVEELVASYKTTEPIGLGDGGTMAFSHTLTKDPGIALIPTSVRMYYGSETEVLTDDDGDGILHNSLGVAVGTIDYDTGAITGTFTNPPAVDLIIYVEFRHELDYSRNEVVGTGDGVEDNFHGATKYSPVNPFDVPTGLKGIVFSDGTRTVADDGSGVLRDQLGVAVGTIDYDTGAYDFTFPSPPADLTSISAAYMQILRTDSEDIPIDKDQMSIKSGVTLETLTS